MTNQDHYIIRGGDAGAARLQVLSQAILPFSMAVLERANIAPGKHVLDLGCGSGEVTISIANKIGPTGRVVGVEMDDGVLQHARESSAAEGVNVEWRQGRVEDLDEKDSFDIVYSRFLLSHLADPAEAIAKMHRALRPRGKLVIEDIDISAHVHWPKIPAFQKYQALYCETARCKGVNPLIGPSLPAFFLDAGFEDVQTAISMPVFREGPGKTIARLTLTNIAETAIAEGLANKEEIAAWIDELRQHEENPRSIQSIAQTFQVVGTRN